jgi:hypothetical protein
VATGVEASACWLLGKWVVPDAMQRVAVHR